MCRTLVYMNFTDVCSKKTRKPRVNTRRIVDLSHLQLPVVVGRHYDYDDDI